MVRERRRERERGDKTGKVITVAENVHWTKDLTMRLKQHNNEKEKSFCQCLQLQAGDLYCPLLH